MSQSSCLTTFPPDTLIEYWLGELAGANEAQFEEHLFACEHCTERLRGVAQLAGDIRSALRDGKVHAITTPSFIDRLHRDGMRIREYRLQTGDSVECTVTPHDDLVVAHLRAPLRGVRRLDLLVRDITAGTSQRMHDVAFDPATNEIVLMSNVTQLRQMDVTTVSVELLATDNAGERAIGEYTFNHSPTRE